MKNVLLLGNGFDISFGLPTKYTDFILVMHYLIMNENHFPEEVSHILKQAGVKTLFLLCFCIENKGTKTQSLFLYLKKEKKLCAFVPLCSYTTPDSLLGTIS